MIPLVVFILLYGPFLYFCGWKNVRHYSVDFPSFYYAAQVAFQMHLSPYPGPGLPGVMADQALPFLYPPPTLFVFAPMAWLPFPVARVGLLLVNHLCVLLLLWLVPARLCGLSARGQPLRFSLVIALLLLFYPIAVTLEHGQINLILTVLICLMWLALRSRRESWAGLFLAGAIVLKTYPALLLLFLPLMRRNRAAVAALGAMAALTAVAAAVVPHQAWTDWYRVVLPSGGYFRTPAGLFSPAAEWNQSLNGFFSRLFTKNEWSAPAWDNPALGRALAYLFAASMTALSLGAVWRVRRSEGTAPIDRAVAVALPLVYLVAPLSWEHHLVYVLPAAVWMLMDALARKKFVPLAFLAASLIVIAAPHMLAFKFLAALALWVTAVLDCRGKPEPFPPNSQPVAAA